MRNARTLHERPVAAAIAIGRVVSIGSLVCEVVRIDGDDARAPVIVLERRIRRGGALGPAQYALWSLRGLGGAIESERRRVLAAARKPGP